MADPGWNGGGKFVGKPVLRTENATLLRGTGEFVDDVAGKKGTLHAAVLRSPHPHAEIVSIDTTAALEREGVVAAVTRDDVLALTDPFIVGFSTPMDYRFLAIDRVRYVGEPVAVIVAKDRYLAEDALDDIEIAYRPLPAVVDPVEASGEGAPILHPAVGSNVLSERHFVHGDPAGAFAEATHTTSLSIIYPRNSITPLEGYAVLADYEPGTGAYDVLSNFHGPFSLHPVMARGLRVEGNKLRLRTAKNSGGSFGTKLTLFPYIVMTCLAARKARRPVKWIEDRLENLSASCAAPNRVTDVEAAHDADGVVSALRFVHYDDHGAYLRAPMPAPIYRMHGVCTSCYDIANVDETIHIVTTNKTPSGAVRGFGGPQHYFALERLMHKIALELGHERIDVIRRNLIPADAFPYRAAAGALLDSGDYERVVGDTLAQGGLDELKRRQAKARANGGLYGIGFAATIEPSQSNMGYISTVKTGEERRRAGPKDGAIAYATVNVDPLGAVTVTTESAAQGQGHETALAQVIADRLGLRPEAIVASVDLDTQKGAWSLASGNYSSRFAPGAMSAAYKAAGQVRDKLARIASAGLNVPPDDVEFAEGRIFARNNPDNALPFRRVAGLAHWSPGSLPDGMPPGVNETAAWSASELTPTTDNDEINSQLAYGFGFDFCGVEIDRATGDVRIDRYVSGHDCGTIINPAIAKGQIEGSFAAAVGAALYEEFAYGEDGSFLSGTFAEYLIGTAHEVPTLTHVETAVTPSPFTLLGAKGIGEGNCFSTPVCIANAVADALGIEDVRLPLTPSRVYDWIHGPEPAPPVAAPPHDETAKARMLSGRGETIVPAPPEDVWDILLDPERLGHVIPGCGALEKVGSDDYRAVIDIGVGPVRGTFKANVRLSELDRPRSERCCRVI